MRRTSALLLCAGILLTGTAPSSAQPVGGAWLDTGLGARAAGMGGAIAASVDGPAALFYNPAGLTSRTGRSLLASFQPMSLERTRAGLAGSINVRGPLAFGLAWLHAGVGGLTSRNGSGEVIDGDLTDNADAFLFGLGIQASERLQLGLSVKVVDHRIDAPQVGESSASGRSVDVGARYRLAEATTLSLSARNVFDKLSWTIVRPAAQKGTSEESLLSTLGGAVSHRWRDRLVVGLDVELVDPSGDSVVRAHAGVEARLSPLVTLRGGVHRLGDADGAGLPAFGVTLQPMRSEAVQITYAWVADDIGDGGRRVLSLSSRF
jgi:hypothetical protein